MHPDHVKAALHNPGITRRHVLGAGALCAATFIWAFVARRQSPSADEPVRQPIDARRTFTTEGSTPGTFVLRDVPTHDVIKTFGPTEDNFVRSTLKGLERLRRTSDVSLTTPFELTRYRDGTLLLIDLGTGQRFDLVAFGRINMAQFAELLPPGGTTR